MSVTPAGKGKCDACGWIGPDSGLNHFLVANKLDDEGRATTLHFCLKSAGGPGCGDKMLNVVRKIATSKKGK